MDSKAVSSAITTFSMKFCNELEKDKSVISSPLSAEFLLGLLTLGTTDPEHTELLTALGCTDDDSICSLFSTVSSKLKELKGVTLNVANKVYIQDGDYDLQPKVKQDATEIFDAEMEKVNFCERASTVKNINEWVEKKTNNKIKNLMTLGSVNSLTRLVLVNAIYFKGTWKDKFKTSNTKELPFHVNADKTVQVPMMYKKLDCPTGYSEELQAQFLDIPYIGDDASMLIVLPKEIEGLSDLMAKLVAGHDLSADIENMRKKKYEPGFPSLKLKQR